MQITYIKNMKITFKIKILNYISDDNKYLHNNILILIEFDRY